MGGSALRLQKSLTKAYPNTEIECQPAEDATSKIEVYWIDGEKRKLFWSKGKTDTENGHNEIIKLVKHWAYGMEIY